MGQHGGIFASAPLDGAMRIALVLTAATLAAPALHAQAVPTTLSYQGVLTDGAGTVVRMLGSGQDVTERYVASQVDRVLFLVGDAGLVRSETHPIVRRLQQDIEQCVFTTSPVCRAVDDAYR